jgi:hypothetical protein
MSVRLHVTRTQPLDIFPWHITCGLYVQTHAYLCDWLLVWRLFSVRYELRSKPQQTIWTSPLQQTHAYLCDWLLLWRLFSVRYELRSKPQQTIWTAADKHVNWISRQLRDNYGKRDYLSVYESQVRTQNLSLGGGGGGWPWGYIKFVWF